MSKSTDSGLQGGFVLGPWRVEPARNVIFQEGIEKRLENRVMQTLVYLAEHEDEVVTREQFFDTVWQGLVVNEEALSRAISLLRTALGDKAQRPSFIQTIPGVGYRLIAKVALPGRQTEAEGDVAQASKLTSQQRDRGAGSMVRLKAGSKFRNIALGLAVVVTLSILGKFVLTPGVDDPGSVPPPNPDSVTGSAEANIGNSVAVLPFVNLSSDPEQEHFADGMTEELLNILAGVPKLRVTARTSSFFFKGKDMPITRIGEMLNVGHVLEGSVRRSGSKVRITAQLIEARTDRHLWSQTYNREMEDIFAIQDEVAAAIANELTDSLDGLERRPVSRAGSLRAYESYRNGRLHWSRRTVDGLHEAIDLFEQTIQHDPGFAPAYAAIADSWMLLVTYGDVHIMKGGEIAEAMVNKALELDPDCAEAYAALGLSRLIFGRKEEAEFALRRAIELDDGYIPAYLWMSNLLSDLGRIPEAATVLVEATTRDPLNELLAVNFANNLQARGDNEAATESLQTLIRFQPGNAGLLSALSGINLASGQLVDAWKHARQAYEIEPENVVIINNMGRALVELGEFEEAERVWLEGIALNRKSIELKIQLLTMYLMQGKVMESEDLMYRIFGDDVESLPEGFQRTYHYFMGLLKGTQHDYAATRDHFERVIDPIVDQLYDRNQIFVLTTASLINRALGQTTIAENQLQQAERVVGHARVDGIANADIYFAASSILAMRGDHTRALQSLEQAYEKGFRQNWILEWDGRFDSLREESGFIALRQVLADDIEGAWLEVQKILNNEQRQESGPL